MLNTQLIKAFIRHILTAKTRHGVHSPFVYSLIEDVIYKTKDKSDNKDIELLRTKLLKDNRRVAITDLGAGSMLSNRKEKPVKEIAAGLLKAPRLARLIYRLARHQNARSVIELGTCLGLTTAYLARAAPDADVISIEGCPNIAAIAAQNLNSLAIDNVRILNGNFDTLLPRVLSEMDTVDLVFIDGNHRKQATLDYFYQILPKANENTLLIFDDIYWSKGMEEAWNEIKSNPKVTVAVDLFWIGLVYFKKGQAKEDFNIRF